MRYCLSTSFSLQRTLYLFLKTSNSDFHIDLTVLAKILKNKVYDKKIPCYLLKIIYYKSIHEELYICLFPLTLLRACIIRMLYVYNVFMSLGRITLIFPSAQFYNILGNLFRSKYHYLTHFIHQDQKTETTFLVSN